MADMTENIVDKAEKQLMEGYSRRHKSQGLAKFDPMIIAPILLELAMSMLKNCLEANNNIPDNVSKIIKKRPVIARTMIRLTMRQSGYAGRNDTDAIIDTLMDTGERATPQEIMEFTNPNNFMV